jgi:tRNA pseudouridine13 synthase
MIELLEKLSFAYGKPTASGKIKASAEDFYVDELLGFDLTGVGEHLFLQIEKKLYTTEEVARMLAKQVGLPLKSVSYAGLKDKFATTRQWFSLHLPGKDNPDVESLNTEYIRVINAKRHNKKLKTGALKENHFKIRVSDFVYEQEELNRRIQLIQENGVPNYFGPQRFGNNGSNLDKAQELLLESKKIKNRYLRGIYYSAARALLFNLILTTRVNNDCWNKAVDGDLMMLAGTKSVFHVEQVDEEITRRVMEHDVFPAGVLWGEGDERLTSNALAIQKQALGEWQAWCEALCSHRLQRDYRSMVLLPRNLRFEEGIFSFSLPKGAFATTVLREIFNT